MEIKISRLLAAYVDEKVKITEFLHYLAFLKQYPDGDLTQCRIPIERITGYVNGEIIAKRDYGSPIMLEIMNQKVESLKRCKLFLDIYFHAQTG